MDDDDKSLRLLLGAIAEQQYRFHLLLKLLIEKKIITNTELDSKFDESAKFQYSHDLLEHLVATGLKIGGNSPSSCQQESQVAVEPERTVITDPGLETKS